MGMPEFSECASELENYNFIRSSKEKMGTVISLQVDLAELITELDKIQQA